jgi:hypothetical protein
MSDLPSLPKPSRPVAYGVFRGGGGQLSFQTQSVVKNLHRTILPHVKGVRSILGMPHCGIYGLLAKLTGISRQALQSHLLRMKTTNYPKVPKGNGGGRKRKATAPVHALLPDLTAEYRRAAVTALPDLSMHVHDLFDPNQKQEPQTETELPIGTFGEGSRSTITQQWALALSKQVACPYQGLGTVSEDQQDQIAGIRLASLALRLVVNGSTANDFEGWVHFIDSHFPGEIGEINHSKKFAAEIAATAVQHVRTCTAPRP